MSLVAESQSAHHTLTTRSFVSKHSKAQRNSSRQLDAVIKQSSAQQNRTADQFDRLIAQQGKLVDALGEKPSGAVFSETVSARCYVQVLTSCPQVQMDYGMPHHTMAATNDALQSLRYVVSCFDLRCD